MEPPSSPTSACGVLAACRPSAARQSRLREGKFASGIAPRTLKSATTEARWVRWTLIGVALVFMTLFLFIPLASVFYEALKKGVGVYWAAISDDDALSAMKLTLIATGSEFIELVDDTLTLEGLRLVYERTSSPKSKSQIPNLP